MARLGRSFPARVHSSYIIVPAAGTLYTDSATATLSLVASSTENAQFVDSTTATTSLVASAAESHIIPDAAIGQVTLAATAAETAQFVDSTTAQLTLDGSATTETAQFVDSATATASLVTSSIENAQFVDAVTASVSLVASSTLEQHTTFDATTAQVTLAASASEIYSTGDSATAQLTLSASLLTLAIYNSFEGGTAGTNITHANSGGTSGVAFDTVTTGADGVAQYTATAAHGGLAGSIQAPTSGTTTLQYNTSIPAAMADGYGRVYVRVPDFTLAHKFVFGRLGGADVWSIRVITAGQIRILDSANATQATGSVAVTAGQFFRVEWHHNSTGQLVVRLYTDPDSYTIADTITAAANTASNIDEIRIQNDTTSPIIVDDIAAAVPVWPGPYGSGETLQAVDSGTATLSLTASATENAQFVDATTTQVTFTPSGVEILPNQDANTGQLTLTSSSTQVFAGIDATTAQITLSTGGTTEIYIGNAYVDDTFTRTVSNDWGTASPIGGPYTLDPTGLTTLSVNGTRGLIQNLTTAADHMMQTSVSVADTDSIITFSIDALPVGGVTYLGPGSRMVSSGDAYRTRVRIGGGGAVALQLEKIVASTNIVLLSFTTILTGYTAGTDITVKFRVQGDTPVNLYAKVWYTVSSEPTAWSVSTTDAANSFVSPGFCEIRYSDGTTNNPTASVDRYQVLAPSVAGTTFFDADTPTVTLTASAVETAQTVDVATPTVTLAASGTEAVGDFGTGQVIFTPSALDLPYNDTQQTLLQLLASFVEVRGTTDLATANLTFTPSATEVRLFNDVATALLTFVPTEIFPLTSFVDSATATLKLVTSAVDTQLATDFCLEGTPYMMWTSKMVGYSWTNSTLGFAYVSSNLDHWESRLVGRCPV